MSLRASAWGPAKGHPLRGEEPQGSVAPPLAFGRWGAWRTLGRRGVAIRFPAEIPDMSVVLRANSQCFSYSPKGLLFGLCCRRRTDCHVASLLAMTEGGRPCTRRRVSVFCMSLRTSAGGPAKGHPLRGEEPQGSVALLWPLAGAGHGGLWGDDMADFGATRCGNPHPRSNTGQ